MKSQTLGLSLILILMSMFLISCDSYQQSTLYSSSGGSNSPTPTPSPMPTDKPLAECNQVSGVLNAKIKMYYDDNGTPRDNAIRMKIVTLPAEMTTNDKYTLQFFWWRMESYSQSYLNTNPARLRAEINGTPIATYTQTLNQKYIKDIATNYGLTGSLQELADKMVFVLVDLDFSYDALQVAAYRDGSLVTTANALIPAFFADPNHYAYESNGTTPRAPTLLNLHPFISQRNSWSTSQFWQQSTSFCF